MRFIHEMKYDFKDVLIVPKRSILSSRGEVDLFRSFTFRNSGKQYKGVPIMAANMDGVGTFDMVKSFSIGMTGLFVCLSKHYSVNELISFIDNSYNINQFIDYRENYAYSLGIVQKDLDKFQRVYDGLVNKDNLKYICIDVANGYTEKFVDFVAKFRDTYKDKFTIIAGNVVTGEMTEELLLKGADIVKVGIGPGSVCTTRIQTGVGYPQLSAIIECADSAHGLRGHIIADGGCTSSGDIAKAFGAGADFVMLGGMFAGHQEGLEDDILKLEIGDPIPFYGMSSTEAMQKHGGKPSYRASEGKSVTLKYKGYVTNTVNEILGGVRSACTYVGAKSLKELSKRTTFIRVNNTHNRIFE